MISDSVLIGGNNSVSDLAKPGNLLRLLSFHRTELYASVFALDNMLNKGDAYVALGSIKRARQIVTTFIGTGGGVGEEFYDTYGTPSLPVDAHNDGGSLNSVNGPVEAAAIGFSPTIMMMNINYSGKKQFLVPLNLEQFHSAVLDIKTHYPNVKCVYPYINGQDPDWSDANTYWSLAKAMIRDAGGVGIDIPVGLPLLPTASPNYLLATANEIKWAQAAGLVTVLLLTPFSTSAPHGVLGQFANDNQFLFNTKKIIEYLKSAKAVPSLYVVSNYSPWHIIKGHLVTANRIGSDTDSNTPSIAYVARWIAENTPTSRRTITQ